MMHGFKTQVHPARSSEDLARIPEAVRSLDRDAHEILKRIADAANAGDIEGTIRHSTDLHVNRLERLVAQHQGEQDEQPEWTSPSRYGIFQHLNRSHGWGVSSDRLAEVPAEELLADHETEHADPDSSTRLGHRHAA